MTDRLDFFFIVKLGLRVLGLRQRSADGSSRCQTPRKMDMPLFGGITQTQSGCAFVRNLRGTSPSQALFYNQVVVSDLGISHTDYLIAGQPIECLNVHSVNGL